MQSCERAQDGDTDTFRFSQLAWRLCVCVSRVSRQSLSQDLVRYECELSEMNFSPDQWGLLKLLEARSLLQSHGCNKCKKYTVQTREYQTRSADEPMTVFVTCEN